MAAATASQTDAQFDHGPTALDQRAEGPMVPGFRDSLVAEKLHSDVNAEEAADKSVTTRVYEQMTSFNRLVTGGVTLAVGILVYNEVVGALPSGEGAINQTLVTSTVESAFQLAPVALIVLIAAFILAQVMGFRMGN